MSDLSSESESAFDIEDIPEENRDYIREILQKGKNIAPFYSVVLL